MRLEQYSVEVVNMFRHEITSKQDLGHQILVFKYFLNILSLLPSI